MAYKIAPNYNTAMILLEPVYSKSKGNTEKSYPDPKDVDLKTKLFFGTFKTFGGTESDENGIHTLLDTGKIECWYRQDIKAECRIYIPTIDKTFDIEGEPEDIGMSHKTLYMNVRRVGGRS